MSFSSANISQVTPNIGALLSGFKIKDSLNEKLAEFIYRALIDYQVLFIRDQIINADQQLTFAKLFGEIDKPHPIYPCAEDNLNVVMLESGKDNPPDTDVWHKDLTFYANPPFASVLAAKEIPACGGDTLWANMYSVYEKLPKYIQQSIQDLHAIHDMGSFRNNYLKESYDTKALDHAMQEIGSHVHPIVAYHPVTQRPYLNVNHGFTRQIVGMAQEESDTLLHYLYKQVTNPIHQVRLKWETNTLVMWDNRCTQHYAVADYLPHYRKMYRVTIVHDCRAN